MIHGNAVDHFTYKNIKAVLRSHYFDRLHSHRT